MNQAQPQVREESAHTHCAALLRACWYLGGHGHGVSSAHCEQLQAQQHGGKVGSRSLQGVAHRHPRVVSGTTTRMLV